MSDIKGEYDVITNIWDRAHLILMNIWKKKDIGNDVDKYRNHLQETFGKIKILGMLQSVNVKDIYVDLKILPKTRETDRALTKTDFSYADLSDRKFQNEKRHNSTEVIKKLQNIFILGKPGAGKTTLLKHITIKALSNSNNKHIPVFISLKEFSENKIEDTLYKQVMNTFEIHSFSHAKPFVDKMLQDGNFMILLDGLDEVSESEINRVSDDICKFTKRFYKNKFIMSCRIHAARDNYEDFSDVELADFDSNQVNKFIENWFNDNKEKRKKCIRLLSTNENKGIKELATQPLLLIFLCLYFNDTNEFPKNRAELYKEAINVLLVKWDSDRDIDRATDIYKKLVLSQKTFLYSEIAGEAFFKDKFSFTLDELQKQLFDLLNNFSEIQEGVSENQVLKSMVAQHGLFIPIAYQRYVFSHLTLQEYLTTNYIQYKNLEYKLIDLYFNNDHWREVFILYSGHLQLSDEFLLNLKRKTNTIILSYPLKSLLSSVKDVTESFKIEYSQSAFYVLAIARALDMFRTNIMYRRTAINIITDIAFILDPSINNNFNNRINFYQSIKGFTSKLMDEIDVSISIDQNEMTKFIEYLKSQLLLIECVSSATCVSHFIRDDIEKSILSIS